MQRRVIRALLAALAVGYAIAAVAVVADRRDGEDEEERERAAVRAADPRIPMLRKQPGAGPCRIPAGGPRPRLLQGWCQLRVDLGDGTALLTFEERWGPVAADGDASARRFRYRWAVSVVGGRVERVTEGGNAPPQYWR